MDILRRIVGTKKGSKKRFWSDEEKRSICDLLKIIWWDSQGACLFSKRREKSRFVWPATKDGKVSMTAAQLSMLLGGTDWRMPQKTWRPLSVG